MKHILILIAVLVILLAFPVSAQELATNTPVAYEASPTAEVAPIVAAPAPPPIPAIDPSALTSREWVLVVALFALTLLLVVITPTALIATAKLAPRWSVDLMLAAGGKFTEVVKQETAKTENTVDDALAAELDRRFAALREQILAVLNAQGASKAATPTMEKVSAEMYQPGQTG